MAAWYRVVRTSVAGMAMAARASTLPTPPGATPAVCVHGLAITGRYMLPLARRLAEGRRTWVPDLPGYGLSPAPRTRRFDVAGLAEALAAWMDATATGPAVLVGNSMGCQVAARVAAERPDLARALVLLGPTVDPRARTAPRQLARLVVDSAGEPPALVALELFDTLQTGVGRAVDLARSALADRIEDALPRVRCPALVVRGARDALVPRRWAEDAAALLPRGTFVEVPGPHVVNWVRAADGAAAIEGWLATERVP